MPYLKLCYANVAQLVVQLIRNQQVASSSLAISSTRKKLLIFDVGIGMTNPICLDSKFLLIPKIYNNFGSPYVIWRPAG